MAKDGQVCFHRRLFADPVKPQRCTAEPVRLLDGINKDAGGAKLLLTTTSVYPEDCACICPLLKTQHHCLCPNGRHNLERFLYINPVTAVLCYVASINELSICMSLLCFYSYLYFIHSRFLKNFTHLFQCHNLLFL